MAFVVQQRFWQISDPTSDKYGQHMTASEVGDLLKPPEAVMAQLEGWAASVPCIHRHEFPITQDYMILRMDAACASKTFQTEMHLFATNATIQTRRPRTLIRSRSAVTIPGPLVSIVEMIHGLNDFPTAHNRRTALRGSGYPGDSMTPLTVAKAYGLSGIQGSHQGSLALAEFEQEYFYPSDIQVFWGSRLALTMTFTVSRPS